MRLRVARIFSAIAVVGVCGLAMSRGWDIVSFSMADPGLDPRVKRTEAIRPWIQVPGLAFSARESLLAFDVDPADENGARKQRNDLADILAVRPLSSEYWLSLATWLVTDQPSTKLAEALTLSTLTGAREGHLMTKRGVFGVSRWEVLPPEIRKRTAAELAAVSLSSRETARLKGILSPKTEKVRQEIRTALQAEGFSPKVLAGIGL
jgi:hypothetical protein